jgi:hypothetical protein
MAISERSVANQAIDAYGNPGSNPPPSWWQQVKSWIEEYIKPLVPAAQLSAELARIMEIIRNLLGGRG